MQKLILNRSTKQWNTFPLAQAFTPGLRAAKTWQSPLGGFSPALASLVSPLKWTNRILNGAAPGVNAWASGKDLLAAESRYCPNVLYSDLACCALLSGNTGTGWQPTLHLPPISK